MTVGELEFLCSKIKDKSMVVMIPLDEDMFISPCLEESGVEELILDENDNEEPTFVLVPCGFYCDVEEEFDPNMN